MESSNARLTIEKIDDWKNKITATQGAEQGVIAEFAIFKIWILFEKYLSNRFVELALGKEKVSVVKNIVSVGNELPEISKSRSIENINRLTFDDEKHLYDVLKDVNSNFIDYPGLIQKKGDLFLKPNPFKNISSYANFSNSINQLKAIRNYIAHQSIESKERYIKCCFSGKRERFVEVSEYLLTKHDGSRRNNTYRTNFSFYVYILKEIINYLDNKDIEEK